MVSSQIRQYTNNFDEILGQQDSDYNASGLKMPSVIRVGRLAVVEAEILLGTIGEINPTRLKRIKERLAQWLCSKD